MPPHELHHREHIVDIRNAYDSSKACSSPADSDRSLERPWTDSDESYQTVQTQPTEYSGSPRPRPSVRHHDTCEGRPETPWQYFDDRKPQISPRSSTDTYASTIPDEEDLVDELSEFDLPEYTARTYETCAIPATPADFSELFPSHRRLTVRHDDSTLDGNMNLRVDTEIRTDSGRCDITLFHLRMHDLKNREFSLRRYCRDSGREVCHTISRRRKPAGQKRPGFSRSLSNALSSMRPAKSDSQSSTTSSLKRNDSGYGSMHSVDFDGENIAQSGGHADKAKQHPTNTIKLEFSNYAQMELKRVGVKSSKRYEFEYWGISYAWRRVVKKNCALKEVAYHLTKANNDQALAHIVPVPLSPSQAQDERLKGGWIAPCSFWISDEKIVRSQKDVSDVVVASGLLALVDDSISARFHAKRSTQLLIPVPKLQMGVEYVGPKHLINEIFRRDGNTPSQSRRSTSSRPSTSGGDEAKLGRLNRLSRQTSYG